MAAHAGQWHGHLDQWRHRAWVCSRKRPSKAPPARPYASKRGTPPTKLPTAAQANDLISTDRGQSKCAQEHLSEGGRGEVRHLVTAEIVVVAPEDIEDYQAFEVAIIAPRRRGGGAGAPACIAVM